MMFVLLFLTIFSMLIAYHAEDSAVRKAYTFFAILNCLAFLSAAWNYQFHLMPNDDGLSADNSYRVR